MIINNKYITDMMNEKTPIRLIEYLSKTNDCYIAGGMLTSIINKKNINDIDIFSMDKESYARIAKYMSQIWPLEFKSDNARTYLASDKNGNDIKIQLINYTCMCGSAEEVINKFDFTISMASYNFVDNSVLCHDNFFIDNTKKELIYNPNSIRPLSTLYRLKKLFKRGYTIDGINLIKLGLAISKINIKTVKQYINEVQGIDTYILKNHFRIVQEMEKFDLDNVLSLLNNMYEHDLQEDEEEGEDL
jgi:hypothetical protein